jgi:hypothetical protein
VALVALAALLTTSLCLGPLYQRAMEQALTGSVLDHATPAKRAITLTSHRVRPARLAQRLPGALAPYVDAPVRSAVVGVSAPTATDGQPVVGRLYAADGLCDHVRTVSGHCPQLPDEVMVSAEDAEVNGWQLGGTIAAAQLRDSTVRSDQQPHGTLAVVGIYEPVADGWLGAPLTDRVGLVIADPPNSHVVTDDWLTVPKTLQARDAVWIAPASSATWALRRPVVDVDSLLEIGPQVKTLKDRTRHPGDDLYGSVVSSDIDLLAGQVADQRGQARTTVGVLVAQLVVLAGIVLWMVLVSATDNRRSELALARLRGRGRRGARRYLLAELLPIGLLGVLVGVVAAPFAMALVGRLVFPQTVPVELRWPLAATAAAAVAVVAAVVVAATGRAAREPVDSLLRGVPPAQSPGAGETAVIAFSLTAVVALATVDLAGPLATLAPTLLAVAVGLLLARTLRRSVQGVGRWLLRRGSATAGAGLLTSVRRPAGRRVLVMVVVAAALAVFCLDALVTGERNRENAAEQSSGAPYVIAVRPADLGVLVATLATVDPGGTRLSPVVSIHPNEVGNRGQTLAVLPRAWAAVASFPGSDRAQVPWRSILAPQVPPVEVDGSRLRGSVDFSGVAVDGNPALRDVLRVVAEIRDADGGSRQVDLAPVPAHDGTVRIDADLHGHSGWTLTGLGVTSANTIAVSARVVFTDLTLDGRPLDLGAPGSWHRAAYDDGGSVVPTSDGAGHLGMVVTDAVGVAHPMLSAWVPDPVPALVSSPEPEEFAGPGLSAPIPLRRAATLPTVAGAPPRATVVDLEGLLRRPDAYPVKDAAVRVWGRDRELVDRAAAALKDAGIPVDELFTQADARQRLDDTPAAWSIALSVLVAGVALVVAALVMLVVAATTWRARAADLAALRMAGLRPGRLRLLEVLGTLPMVLLGCLAGGGCGVVAARFALPDVRQFTQPPEVSTTDFSVPWTVVVSATLVAAALLAAITLATSAWTAARSRLGHLRRTG